MKMAEILRPRLSSAVNVLEHIWRAVLIFTVGFMAAAVLWQVVARYFNLPTSSALVELIQYAFSIATFAGAAILFRRREHLSIGFVLNAMPARLRKAMLWVSDLLTMLMLALLAYLSIDFIDSGMARYSPVLRLPVGWVYLIVGVALVSALLFAIEARLRGDASHSTSTDVPRHSVKGDPL
jgi:TRAP-type transport system small permease protein